MVSKALYFVDLYAEDGMNEQVKSLEILKTEETKTRSCHADLKCHSNDHLGRKLRRSVHHRCRYLSDPGRASCCFRYSSISLYRTPPGGACLLLLLASF